MDRPHEERLKLGELLGDSQGEEPEMSGNGLAQGVEREKVRSG